MSASETSDEVHLMMENPDGTVERKALHRLTTEELEGIGHMLQKHSDKATKGDMWLFRLYSGMVAERFLYETATNMLTQERVTQIEDLAKLMERTWALEELLVKCGNPMMLETEGEKSLYMECGTAIKMREFLPNDPQSH